MPAQRFDRRLQPRHGGVTPLAVLSLSLLVGVVAVAVDGGSLMEARRHVQAAADAAALAAATDLFANYSSNQGSDPDDTAKAGACPVAPRSPPHSTSMRRWVASPARPRLSSKIWGGLAPVINYGPPIPDPLRSLADPDPIQLGLPLRAQNRHISRGSADLYPGVYVGGITVSGKGTAILHANTDGTPGIYFLQGGGLIVSGSASVLTADGETAGVLHYNDWSQSGDIIALTGKAAITLTPPISGTYQGMSIFQKRGTLSTPVPTLTLSGSGAMNVAGTIYAAYAAVNLSGKAGAQVMGGQLIANTLILSGSADINIDRGSYPIVNTRSLGLVE